ncbi:MAG: hypothetical protein CL910_21355 [Deltaproteobacteria bacterium]|jgi:2-keto-4-pentenoate hydratase/2-oxohepta-3-ene-1,7-dioic acid hydratase in catechol pathway|nr:hypothetical protein [Deltaproteobacteria bacterium]
MTLPRLLLVFALALPAPLSATALADCLDDQEMPRVARILGSDGSPQFVLVVAQEEGRPTRVSPLAPEGTPLAEVFRLAAARSQQSSLTGSEVLAETELATRVCSPVSVPQPSLDAEQSVIVAAGLNYAAHAEEAGGGDVMLFPKAVEPTGPYDRVAPPEGVALLDWEVELGLVLVEAVHLDAPPDEESLLEQAAYFVTNDVSDREPIIREKALTGPGTGFVKAKAQPGFLPAGPWMVRGRELGAALFACASAGMGLHLDVDEGAGPTRRQEATTGQMILDPLELLARLREQVEREGRHSPMAIERSGTPKHYPLALESGEGVGPWLPAGTVLLTGTPEGVALTAPSIGPVLLRGLLRLRGPLEQFRIEERERAAAGAPGGYLQEGDVVHAAIDGLGAQRWRVAAAGSPAPRDPCRAPR